MGGEHLAVVAAAVGPGMGLNQCFDSVLLDCVNQDWRIRRTAASEATIDDNAGGPATLSIPGAGGVLSEQFGRGAAASGSGSTAIGQGSSATGDDSLAVGQGSVAVLRGAAVGVGATTTGASAVAIGRAAIAAANQFVSGSDVAPITDVFIGEGVTSTAPGTTTYHGTRTTTSETDVVGGLLVFASGEGTGAAGRSTITFQTPEPTGTGTAQQVLATRLAILADGTVSAPGSGVNSEQWGSGAVASGLDSTAVGFGAAATADDTTALGKNATGSAARSVVVGEGATASGGANGTAIGQGATASGVGGGNTAVGTAASSTAAGGASTVIGHQATDGGVTQATAVGKGATTAGGTNPTAVGFGATASGSSSTALGHSAKATGSNSGALGQGAKADAGFAIALGVAADSSGFTSTVSIGFLAKPTAANQFVCGSAIAPILNVFFGQGPTADTPGTVTHSATRTNTTETDVAGSSIVRATGAGTGSATGSSYSVQTPTPTGTGTDQQALATRLTIDNLVAKFTVPVELPSFTVATLPTVTTNRMIIVSDETGGLVPAFSDGTNWRRVTDRAVVA